mgnify:CR=1 FL=1
MWQMLLGGLTGLLGTVWSSYNQRKIKELDLQDKQADRAHDLAMVDAESKAMVAEMQANIQVTQAQVEGEVSLQEARAYTTSQKYGNTNVFLESFMDRMFHTTGWVAWLAQPLGVFICLLFGLVDTVKGIARPAITAYLLGVSTWVTIQAWDLLNSMGTALTATQAGDILERVVVTVLYLTTSAVTWWFGDRMTAKGLSRVYGKGGK